LLCEVFKDLDKSYAKIHVYNKKIILYITWSKEYAPTCCHLFVGGVRDCVLMLAGVYTPDRATQARQVWWIEVKVTAQSVLSLYFFPLYLPILLIILLFPCVTRPYITFLRCSDVKPLSLTHSLTQRNMIKSCLQFLISKLFKPFHNFMNI